MLRTLAGQNIMNFCQKRQLLQTFSKAFSLGTKKRREKKQKHKNMNFALQTATFLLKTMRF